MRRVLFRGVPVDGSDWVYGSLVQISGGNTFMVRQTGSCCSRIVNKSSVGESTGMHDRKGSLIFEGDILEDTNGKLFTVKWSDENAGFLATTAEWDEFVLSTEFHDCTIVGNVFDADVPKPVNNTWTTKK